MRLPNTLFIGPDKTGSTWLYELLRGHPACFVPEVKELFFFDRHFERGLEWYAGYFDQSEPHHRVVAEISHDYLFSDAAADRIRETLPGVRLLSFLRDPVERSFSQYLYLLRAGQGAESVREAARRFPRIVDNSRYHDHLTRYLDRFETEQLGIFVFEELVEDEGAFAARVLGHLDPELVETAPSLPGRTLPAGTARVAWAARLAKFGARAARAAGLPGLVGRVKGNAMVQSLLYRTFGGDRPTLSPEDGRFLAGELADDLARLPGRLGWSGLPASWTTTRALVRGGPDTG